MEHLIMERLIVTDFGTIREAELGFPRSLLDESLAYQQRPGWQRKLAPYLKGVQWLQPVRREAESYRLVMKQATEIMEQRWIAGVSAP